MEINQAIAKFSEFLLDNYKQDIVEDDIISAFKKILQDKTVCRDLVQQYGNLPVWLIYYSKKGLNIDLQQDRDAELTKYLHDFNIYSYASGSRYVLLSSLITYDELELKDDLISLLEFVTVKNCVIKGNITRLSRKRQVHCNSLTINMPKLERVDTEVFNESDIDNLILRNNIDIKLFTPNTFKYCKVNTVEYRGKKYTLNSFLKLVKETRNNIKANSSYSDLYIAREDNGGWSKKFYLYIYARKSSRSGKYRFAKFSDMGSQNYSIAYFKSEKDAIDLLKKAGLEEETWNIAKAQIRYEDILRGFKEVETEYGGTILIKNGSPGDK